MSRLHWPALRLPSINLHNVPRQNVSKSDVKSPVDLTVTDEMVAAAEDAHMPFGDMRTALAAALSVAPAHEALNKECDALRTEAEQLRHERDKAINKCVRLAQASSAVLDKEDAKESAELREWQDAMCEMPTASLARRDANMQARALEEAADHTVPAMHKMAEWLRCRARWIRKHGTETVV